MKSPAVPVPDLADFLAQTPSLSCLPQKMRELTRKSRRLLLRPDMACPLSKMTSQPSAQWKGPSEGPAVCFTARAMRPCGAISPLQAGEQHGEARRLPRPSSCWDRAGLPRGCLQLAPFTRPTRLKLGATQSPGHGVGCQGTPQGSWEGKDKHNAFCGESTVLKNLGGKVCLF